MTDRPIDPSTDLPTQRPTVTASLALLLAAALAYLAARVAFDWLARRFLIVSAAEYLVLGIVLGPHVTGLLSSALVDKLAPVITLALGWIGASLGTQFRLTRMLSTRARAFRVALAESAMTFVVVGALEFLVVRWSMGSSDQQALLAAVTLGAMAVACNNTGIAVVTELLGTQGSLIEQLEVSSEINAFFATAAFGLLVCIHHTAAPASRPLTPTEWAVVSIGIGVVGGTLFHLFLGETQNEDRLFVSLVGGIVLVSGAAGYLRLSPLLAGMFFGIVLVNSTSRPEGLVDVLGQIERPFYFILLLFGGATWAPSTRAWIAPVALFVVARAAAKIGASRIAARANGALPRLGLHWGRALLGQGRLALAIGLSYLRQENMPFQNLVFTAAVVSILFTDVFSARLVRAVIVARPRLTSTLPDTAVPMWALADPTLPDAGAKPPSAPAAH